jgi:hypothetical protein
VTEVAKRHSLSPSLLYRWMQSPSKRGVPVFARLAVSKTGVESAVMVHVGRAAIRIEKGFDAELLRDQDAALDRGTMCRYVEEAGSTLGATVVHAMWRDAIANAA